ncbi:unnamed protein product [Microthlaspi erraticum]|uniref:Uncharacterized protein n=1 Tax=Microthlaspi erraticum TaxID=1685480 RepID=A0A6D2I869_9BRAS|nr:unnamed protein product [Microthlaspi erraticum]
MFRSAKVISVRLKSRPKFQTDRPITHHDPGNIPRSATPQLHATPRTTMPREPGTSLAAAQPFAYHGRCIRPSRENVPRPAEKPSAKSHPSDHAGRPRIIRPRPFRLAHDDPTVRPIVPTDRPNAAVDPKPVLKPDFIFSSPA